MYPVKESVWVATNIVLGELHSVTLGHRHELTEIHGVVAILQYAPRR